MAYSPERGATSVPTSSPIVVDFDRPVDEASVASRFSLSPASAGKISWPSDRRLVFSHAPLRTDSDYRVTLQAGYRSVGGGASDLEHTWSFHTEGALQVAGWTPAAGERGVDPAAYLAVLFNHPLSAAGLAAAFALDPATPLDAHLDPADPHRALIAPEGLLQPDQTYTLRALTTLRDVDGNPLPRAAAITFQTGPLRPLHGWLSYLRVPAASPPGTAGSLWIVDANRLPRQLVPGPVLAYTWSPAGDELAVETAPRSWSDLGIGGNPIPLQISADWVAPLGPERGFAFLDAGDLGVLTPAGQRVILATGVQSVALSPDGSQIAYTVPSGSGTEVWALTVELRARYRVQLEAGTVTGLTWSPDETRIAYLLSSGSQSAIRVRALTANGAVTLVSGPVSDPAWDADSQHLFVLGLTGSPRRARIYRLPVGAGAQSLGGAGMPASASLDAGPPIVAPDGHQVAFLSTTGQDAAPELWLMNADGTGLAPLTPPDYSCSEPLWTPA